MTTLNYNNTILPLVQDLDENIVKNRATKHHTTIDFNNPVTGLLERVTFMHPAGDGNIVHICYSPDYHTIGMSFKEGLIIETLEDLYDFILIDEDNSPTEGQGLWLNHTTGEELSSVSDLWADNKGGSTMTI